MKDELICTICERGFMAERDRRGQKSNRETCGQECKTELRRRRRIQNKTAALDKIVPIPASHDNFLYGPNHAQVLKSLGYR